MGVTMAAYLVGSISGKCVKNNASDEVAILKKLTFSTEIF